MTGQIRLTSRERPCSAERWPRTAYALFMEAQASALWVPSHALFWTMLANIGLYVGVSLYSRQAAVERIQAALFVDVFRWSGERDSQFWRGTATISDLQALVARFIGKRRADRAFSDYARSRRINLSRMPEADSWELLSASPLPYFADRSQTPREMSRQDMDIVVADFVRATEYAEEAGFDLLEIHMAHGYLLASFISPLTNERTDDHGGCLENRMRFPLEVFDACRAAWPDEKPMSVRISAVDWAPGGMEPADAVEVARLIASHGCDAVDVSAGQTVPDQQPIYGRLFQTPFADRIRHEVGIATMAVGNVSSWMDVNTIVAAGRADLALLARAHLFDPYWTRHAAAMQGYALPWPPQYRSVARYTPRFEFHFS